MERIQARYTKKDFPTLEVATNVKEIGDYELRLDGKCLFYYELGNKKAGALTRLMIDNYKDFGYEPALHEGI